MGVRLQIDDSVGLLDPVAKQPKSKSIDVASKFAPSNRLHRAIFGNDPSVAVFMPICSQAKSLIERAMHLRGDLVALGAYAVDEVFEFAVVGVLDQPVDIGIKTREFFVEHSSKSQVFDDRLIESLAGDQQWNTRWVGG